jgi:Flp pilus assembly protein TadD
MTADVLGWAYHKLGSTTTALPYLREAVQAAPANPVYQYHLGMAYLASGDSASARRALQKAISGPGFKFAAEARSALEKASTRP